MPLIESNCVRKKDIKYIYKMCLKNNNITILLSQTVLGKIYKMCLKILKSKHHFGFKSAL